MFQDAFSHSISSRTVLSLGRIPSLNSLSLRSFHFSWLNLALRLKSAWYPPNLNLRHFTINFFANSHNMFYSRHEFIDGVPEEEFVISILQHIPRFFPNLQTFHVDGIHGDVLTLNNETSSALSLVNVLRIQKCENVLEIAKSMPKLYCLDLNYYPLKKVPSTLQKPILSNLTKLKINRDNYRIGLFCNDLRLLLMNAVVLNSLRTP